MPINNRMKINRPRPPSPSVTRDRLATNTAAGAPVKTGSTMLAQPSGQMRQSKRRVRPGAGLLGGY